MAKKRSTKIRKKPTSKRKKKKVGRKLFDGKSEKSVVQKLEHAFAIGCTDEQACIYADISVRALYYYQEKNTKFLHRKELLREKPVLLSRSNVMEVLQEKNSGNKPTDRAAELSWKYLERRQKDEFAPHSTVDTTVARRKLTEKEQERIRKGMDRFKNRKKQAPVKIEQP